MEFNKEILKRLPKNARYYRAENYVNRKKVAITDIDYTDSCNYTMSSRVTSGNALNWYLVNIKIKNNRFLDYDCTCQDTGLCKHIMATVLEIFKNEFFWGDEEKIKKYFREIKIKEEENKRLASERMKKIAEEKAYKEKYGSSMELLEAFSNYEENSKLDVSEIYKKVNASKKSTKDTETKIANTDISIIPKLSISSNGVGKLEFKIGQRQMYVLKDLSAFEIASEDGTLLSLGIRLNLYVKEESFDEEAKKILPIILKYGKIIRYANENQSSYFSQPYSTKQIGINENNIDEIMEELKGQHVIFTYSYYSEIECYVNDGKLNIKFTLEEEEKTQDYILKCNLDSDTKILRGKKNYYIIYDEKIYICPKAQIEDIIKIIKICNKQKYIRINRGKINEFGAVLNKIKDNLEKNELTNNIIDKKNISNLGVKVLLDLDNNMNVISNVKFCYNDIEFNPLNSEENNKEHENITRNYTEENKVIEKLFEDGFSVDLLSNTLVMFNEDDVYEFMSNKIDEYMKEYEVLATDRFNKREIKVPKLKSVGVRLESDLLNIDLSGFNIDVSELADVMKAYSLKKKYHKLKNGEFVDLSRNVDLDLLSNMNENMDIDFKQMKNGVIKTSPHRSMYLQKILETDKNLNIEKNEKYNKVIENIGEKDFTDEITIPNKFENTLRSYQRTGYKWLKVLDNYRFGGILADDMGLGKTLQMIALLTSYIDECKENKEKNKTSIVVAPSSLVLNWKNEIEKWSPKITVKIVTGKAEERKTIIDELENYDLIITSYDLLKRDISCYEDKKYTFKYVIADEAQYIKNMTTKNAKSLKTLNAVTRYALTGTPIENSISELWSIFDFIMPGYLYTYNKFRERFEVPIVVDQNSKIMAKLKMLIEPFVLRRIKKEVLTELPDKNITVLKNEMDEKQEKIYLTYLSSIKNEVKDEIEQNGLEKSQIKILALLTRLRQICCHPSLFIENYDGESSKLNQCMDLIDEAIGAGHKILLFSQYTSMFSIIEEKLKEKNIEYFKLTGQTKVDSRIQMVDDFNVSRDVKVFLISLKAGGTGLNLTGSDVVVHYDPWWNLSAENQATDRAYRIGQKNSVQVYKLITSNTIEEKINKLQQEKGELSDKLLSTEETFINKLTKEEIMGLFE